MPPIPTGRPAPRSIRLLTPLRNLPRRRIVTFPFAELNPIKSCRAPLFTCHIPLSSPGREKSFSGLPVSSTALALACHAPSTSANRNLRSLPDSRYSGQAKRAFSTFDQQLIFQPRNRAALVECRLISFLPSAFHLYIPGGETGAKPRQGVGKTKAHCFPCQCCSGLALLSTCGYQGFTLFHRSNVYGHTRRCWVRGYNAPFVAPFLNFGCLLPVDR